MKNLVDEIKMQFGNATSLYRIMSINVGVFLLFTLVRTFLFLFNVDSAWVS